MKRLIVILFVFLLPISSMAETNAKRESIEQLMVIMKVDEILDSIFSQMDPMFQNMYKELRVKESERHLFEEYMLNTTNAMKEAMTWEKLKEPMIEIYVKHYSEKEIDDMLAFYRSESGKSIINKMPVVMEESMRISQKMFLDYLPRLKVMSAEFQEKLKQERMKAQ